MRVMAICRQLTVRPFADPMWTGQYFTPVPRVPVIESRSCSKLIEFARGSFPFEGFRKVARARKGFPDVVKDFFYEPSQLCKG